MTSTRIVLAFAYTVIALAVAFIAGGIVYTLGQPAASAAASATPHTPAEVQACFDYADALDGESMYGVCTTDTAAYDAWIEHLRAIAPERSRWCTSARQSSTAPRRCRPRCGRC